MKIFKYQLMSLDTQTITMPKDAQVLCVQTQYDRVYLWALVDETTEELEDRIFYIYGIGHTIEPAEDYSYIGTYQLLAGELVFHVFEKW